MSIYTRTPLHWKNAYQLIDSGDFEKLERFGDFVLARPEPQALWDKSLNEKEWLKADASFKKEANNAEKGSWYVQNLKLQSGQWSIDYQYEDLKIQMSLSLSSFKHVGIFPEQAMNWDYIYEQTQILQLPAPPQVLNLFAYTGAASLAAKYAGATVVHLDSIKQVVNWANENMQLTDTLYSKPSGNIRWMIDDAFKFVQRENRRQNLYQGIILDPPAYGRGPKGERWILEESLNPLLKSCAEILDPEQHFFVLNLYSLGFSALIAENLINQIFHNPSNLEVGEIFLKDSFSKKLPLGIYARFSK
jgi:23S rRNA (cytosine1962-C5)-methyltransferase